MKKIVSLLVLALVACKDDSPLPTTTTVTTTTQKIEQLAVLDWHKVKGSDAWTANLLAKLPTLGKDLLKTKPTDAKDFCQNFDSLTESQRVEFYAQMIAVMARYESDFNPNTDYYECHKTKNMYGSNGRYDATRGWCMKGGAKEDGGYVVSRGLMQMSLESSQGYGCSWIKLPSDLKDPIKNLDCAITVISRQVSRHGRIAGKTDKWNGVASYWSVMRNNGKDSYTAIHKKLNNLPYCKK